MDGFRASFAAQEVIFGAGALGELGAQCERFGWRRLLLCATAGARARGEIMPIEEQLGERLVASFERVQPHVPAEDVATCVDLATQQRVDAIIALGGGSAIGLAKATSHALEPGATPDPSSPLQQPHIPILAIPTTYAGSEMTPVYGVTRAEDGVARKVTVSDHRVTPGLVIYDPLLTLSAPPQVTAGTGINAVAHCIEALYSITRNPLATAAALGGLRALASALPACVVDGADRAARSEALAGAYLAGTALAHVTMGLHHGICHVLGGSAGLAHGDANGVMLPHVLRFNLEATAPQLAQAAEPLGAVSAGQSADAAAEVVRRIAALTERLGLPQRLRTLGVTEERLPELARIAFANRTIHNNPKPITSVAQIEELLRAAW